MYYLCQHQFSQLVLFTVQILLCLFMGQATVQPLWLLYTEEEPHRAPCIRNKCLVHWEQVISFLPGKLYPWDSSEPMFSPIRVMYAGV